MTKICRDIFNRLKIIFELRGENEMARFIAGRILITFLEEGAEGARQKYIEYFSKELIKKWKVATDAFIKEESDTAFLVDEKLV